MTTPAMIYNLDDPETASGALNASNSAAGLIGGSRMARAQPNAAGQPLPDVREQIGGAPVTPTATPLPQRPVPPTAKPEAPPVAPTPVGTGNTPGPSTPPSEPASTGAGSPGGPKLLG